MVGTLVLQFFGTEERDKWSGQQFDFQSNHLKIEANFTDAREIVKNNFNLFR